MCCKCFCAKSYYVALVTLYLVIHHPAHVLEVAIVEERRTVELHPQTQFLHTERADFWKYISEKNTNNVGFTIIYLLFYSTLEVRMIRETTRLFYRYLLRNTPLKMMSIMLSISALFSRSLRSEQDTEATHWERSNSLYQHCRKTIHMCLTSVRFICIFSSCGVLFCLVVFFFCTSYSFWLFSIPTPRLRATLIKELSSFTAISEA